MTKKQTTTGVSAEQLHEIEVLRRKLHSHAKELNRPFSALASIALFPPVLWLLLFDSRSPFYAIYQQYFEAYVEEAQQEAAETLFPGTHDLINFTGTAVESLKRLFDPLDEMLSLLRENSQQYAEELLPTMMEEMQDILSIPDALRDSAFMREKVRSMIEERMRNYSIEDLLKLESASEHGQTIRSTLIMVFQGIIDYTKGAISIDLESLSTLELYQKLQQIKIAMGISVEPLISGIESAAASLIVRANFSSVIIIPEAIISMLGEVFIIDRLLMRFFPLGVSYYRFPYPDIPLQTESNKLTSMQAQAVIDGVKGYESELAPKAKRNTNIARALIPLLLGLCYAWSDEEMPVYLWLTWLNLAFSASIGIVDETTNLIRWWQYESSLGAAEECYTEVFSEWAKNIDIEKQGDINDDEIKVTFAAHSNLTNKAVLDNVCNVLLSQQLTYSRARDAIYFPATQCLTPEQMTNLALSCQQAIAQQVVINNAAQQLAWLSSAEYLSIDIKPAFKNDFLKTFEVSLTCPSELAATARNVVQLYDNAIIEDSSPGGDVTFNFSVSDALSNEQCCKCMAALQQEHKQYSLKETERVRRAEIPVTTDTSSSGRVRAVAAADLRKVIPEVEVSNAKELPVYGPHRCMRIEGLTNHFAFFKDYSILPNDEGIRKRFHDIIAMAPKKVKQEGEQGLVYEENKIHSSLSSKKQASFEASLAAKPKGHQYGDMRIFARKMTPEEIKAEGLQYELPENAVVHNFCEFKWRTH